MKNQEPNPSAISSTFGVSSSSNGFDLNSSLGRNDPTLNFKNQVFFLLSPKSIAQTIKFFRSFFCYAFIIIQIILASSFDFSSDDGDILIRYTIMKVFSFLLLAT
jgi:hypothetical protein